MANNATITNITLDSLNEEYTKGNSSTQSEKTNGFSDKNYLNTRLGKGETSKELIIRLLPISATDSNPFMHVHMHNVEVPKEMVEQGKKPYKSYICLNTYKNPFIDTGVYGTHCPFCEENKSAYQASLNPNNTEAERKAYVEHSLKYKTKEAIIVRCIDRDHEEEGVKFWKFNIKHDNSDPYHKILNLVQKRSKEALEATGVEKNILDLNAGRDLTITITEGNTDNQVSIDVVEAGFDTPLSKNFEQAKAWVEDTKSWRDVFTVKPYEFLKLVLDMKQPWYDRESNHWIDKAVFDAKRKGTVQAADSEIAKAEAAVRNMAVQGAPVVEETMPPIPNPFIDGDTLPF